MANIAIIAILAIIIGLASGYVYKAKKSGQKCIGCPHSKICNSNTEATHSCSGNCGGCGGGCEKHQ